MIPLGSLVYLKSGGPVMLVVDTFDGGVVASWKVKGEVREGMFYNHTIKVATLPAS